MEVIIFFLGITAGIIIGMFIGFLMGKSKGGKIDIPVLVVKGKAQFFEPVTDKEKWDKANVIDELLK